MHRQVLKYRQLQVDGQSSFFVTVKLSQHKLPLTQKTYCLTDSRLAGGMWFAVPFF